MAEYKDVEQLKKQIADFKRAVNSVKPMNSDYLTGYISALSVVEGAIAEQPTTDVAPVRRGRWINENFCTRCSACGNMTIYDKYSREVESDYCPHCGAKMDGGDLNAE